MQSTITAASLERERTHARLFTVNNRQVLAYLYRDEDDDLQIVMQLWVAQSDEQLRVVLDIGSDLNVEVVFGLLDDGGVEQILSELGVLEMILAIETQGKANG